MFSYALAERNWFYASQNMQFHVVYAVGNFVRPEEDVSTATWKH